MKTETEVGARSQAKFVVTAWDENTKEWIYAGQASTERLAWEMVRRLEGEGWQVLVKDRSGDLWYHSASLPKEI